MDWAKYGNTSSFKTPELIFGSILPIILIVIGTIGNILCINYLLQRQHGQKRSSYTYLIFFCLTDTLSLYQWNLNYVSVRLGNGQQLANESLFLCRSIAFLSFYTLHLSAIFLTLTVIDRTLILWSRYYRFHITKRRNALVISLIVFILLFISDGFLLSLGIIDEHTNQIICYHSLNENLMYFYTKIYPWIHLIIMYIIPFLLMFIGIILIIIKLYKLRSNTRQTHRQQRLSIMLVGMCVVYIILTLPNRLCFSVFLPDIINHIYASTILLASNNLLYTRNATNIIFLYVSSIKFRKQLARIFCYFCHYHHHEVRVLPIQQIQTDIRNDQL